MLGHKSLRAIALLGTLGLSFSLLAQEQPAPATPGAGGEVGTIPVNTPAATEAPAGDDKEATELGTIEVTGSRIKRTDFETSQPVLVVTREDIDRTGLTSVGELLQNLPVAGAALNTSFNNGGDGSTQVDLRNLGATRVLVLVNGRRWVGGVSATQSANVDLNTIPISIIERVEVLKDGASAVYGSDAVAGVVNVITRKDFAGAEARTQWITTDKGDGLQQAHSMSIGSVGGQTAAFLDISYVNQEEILAGDREISAEPLFGTGLTRGSGSPRRTHLLFVPHELNRLLLGPDACPNITSALVPAETPIPIDDLPAGLALCNISYAPGEGLPPYSDYRPWDVAVDPYNFAPINYLLTPSERTGLFGQVGHKITDEINFSSEFLYNVRKSALQLAETPLICGDAAPAPFNMCYVSATNPYNPFNQDIGRGDPAAGAIGLGALLRRMTELGPRFFKSEVDTMRAGGGLDGSFDFMSRLISWDIGYTFTESKVATVESGHLDMVRVARALGPINECVDTVIVDPTGQVGDIVIPAPPTAEGCVPMNGFGGPGTVTQEMLDYVQYTGTDTASNRQKAAYLNFSTELGDLFGMLPAPLGIAFGGEFRDSFFQSQPDPKKVQGTSSTIGANPTRGGYDVSEGYLELSIPLLRDFPFVSELELSAAARYSNYSNFGENVAEKFGIRYKPFGDLLLRSTYSNAFRAPAVDDLYLSQAQSFPEAADPCSGRDDAARDGEENIENVRANCDADGVPTGYAQSGTQVPALIGGNPNLTPETADSITAGIVYSPEWLPDFNIYVDWYSIELVDFIQNPDPQNILDLCYESAPGERTFCDRIARDGTGALTVVESIAANYSGLEVEGVDLTIDYLLPVLKDFGTFKFLLDGSYTTKYNEILPSPGGDKSFGRAGTEDPAGDQPYPRWKANGGLQWGFGAFEASWTTRFIYHVIEECDDGLAPSLVELGLCSNPEPSRLADQQVNATNELESTFYHDVQVGYTAPGWGTKFVLGANNVTGQEPPLCYSCFADTYDGTAYDLDDVVPYARLIHNFK